MLTGWWSDHIGRKHLITAGMLLQTAAIGAVASGTTFGVWAAAQILLSIGTALVYPKLLAVIGDVAHPAWRARALLAGVLADAYGLTTAIWASPLSPQLPVCSSRYACTRPTRASDPAASPRGMAKLLQPPLRGGGPLRAPPAC
ncbi:hypothetical protein [Streptomyces sp. NPDC056401]|uniref:hypothetical protein n=1 Tax=Streptomyces sp. NPDC056401 TaxID=3345809 RepID=UPI0035D6AEF8